MKKFFSTQLCLLVPILFSCLFMSSCTEDIEQPAKESKIEFQQESVTVPAEGGEQYIVFSILNPIEGLTPEPSCGEDWIHDFSIDGNKLKFIVDENGGEDERQAVVDMRYDEKDYSFTVSQSVSNLPFRIEINEEMTTESKVYFSVFPSDKEMTYIVSGITCSYYEEIGEAAIFDAVLNTYEMIAQQNGIPFSDYLTEHVLVSGDIVDQFIPGYTPDTEGYVIAVGSTATGRQLTDVVLKYFRTKAVDKVDMTFKIDVKVDGIKADLSIEPSRDDVYYYFDSVDKASFVNSGYKIEDLLYEIVSTMIAQGQMFGQTPEEVIKSLCSIGKDSYNYTTELVPNTTYMAFAGAVDFNGYVISDVATHEFETGEVSPSDNKISISVSEIGVDKANIDVKTTNSDPYAIVVKATSDYSGKTDEEILADLCTYDLSKNMFTGDYSGAAEKLRPETSYTVYAFGYVANTATTGLVKEEFTTLSSGDPSSFKFSSTVEIIRFNGGTVISNGDPATVLYVWGICESSKTDDDILQMIDDEISRKIMFGYATDRLDYMTKFGVRGSAKLNFSGTPETEYVAYAVAVDEKTGENATGVLRGEPFTTPERKKSNVTLELIADKYWDADEIAEKYDGYQDFAGRDMYCMPITVKTSDEVQTHYMVEMMGDYTTGYSEDELIFRASIGYTDETVYFFQYYERDFTIISVAVDKEGNYTNVVTLLLDKSKDGISDINDFTPDRAPSFMYSIDRNKSSVRRNTPASVSPILPEVSSANKINMDLTRKQFKLQNRKIDYGSKNIDAEAMIPEIKPFIRESVMM